MNNINIKNFYIGWPDRGSYVELLKKVYVLVSNYLLNFPKYKNFTVIFDIDDTLVYTDPAKTLSYNVQKNYKNHMIFPSNVPIVKIAKLCHKLGLFIIIITARPYESEQSSIMNLKLLGINYNLLIHNEDYPNPLFKIKLKKELSKKYNIILSIGDAWHDIKNLNNCLSIKLPDPYNIDAYFTFNNKNYYII
tara:strand:+ start:57 stop:632 length:576 start_codon:yes stop_codon:yes gene_type:complete